MFNGFENKKLSLLLKVSFHTWKKILPVGIHLRQVLDSGTLVISMRIHVIHIIKHTDIMIVKVVPTARRLEMPLSGVCTAIEEMMKKLPVKDRWQLH
nr:hypothetical protein [Tanacetum cinerariifolium]